VTRREFRLPDLGEGLAEAEIVQWLVAAGERVTVNQPLVEVETAKAVVELPSPFAGRLVAIHGETGATLAVGSVLVTVEDDTAEPAEHGPTGTGDDSAWNANGSASEGSAETFGAPADAPVRTPGGLTEMSGDSARGHTVASTARAAGGPVRSGAPSIPAPTGAPPPDGAGSAPTGPESAGAATSAPVVAGWAGGPGERQPTLVGYGPRATAAGLPGGPGRTRRRRHQTTTAAAGRVLAKPPVRRLARDLGVDLAGVAGTGPAGTISRHDVEAAAGILGHPAPVPEAGPLPPPAWPADGGPAWAARQPPTSAPAGEPQRPPAGDGETAATIGQIPDGATFDAATGTWRIKVAGVRRAMARAMVSSAFTAPHVTEFVAVDLTRTLAVRDEVAALPELRGVKVTPLLFVARALLAAVRRHPMVNAGWVEDGAEPEIVVSSTVNLGIAVASPRGLLVPNIPRAGELDLVGLARALHDLTARTRSGQAQPADLAGGTITITNVGVFGVDIGTPILNPGEAAILAVGSIRPAPWVHDGQLAIRSVGQLALSFDHRIVDGALGSAFLADIARMLTEPALMLVWGGPPEPGPQGALRRRPPAGR
jgi:pyruvate dehydrogenase E2 component (dihydrolipoamide acetyltransferase)